MRQTVPAVAALTLLALLAAACGSSNTTGSASSPSAAAAGPKFKACVVSDTGTINDKSFNQSYSGNDL